jgi:hypothetical protein
MQSATHAAAAAVVVADTSDPMMSEGISCSFAQG